MADAKIRLAARVVLCSFLGVCVSAQTALPGWEDRMEAGRRALQARRIEEARQTFEGVRAEALLTNNRDAGLRSVRALNNLARGLGDWAKSEELLNEAIDFAGRIHGYSSAEVSDLLVELASTRRALGRMPEAMASLEQAVNNRLKNASSDPSLLARDLTALGLLQLESKEQEKAKARFSLALAVWERAMREDSEVLLTIENLAGIFRDESDYLKAEPLYVRAVRIREAAFGPNSPELISALDSLAYTYFGLSRWAEAEALYQRLLALWEMSAGPEHPMVSITLDKMVEFYVAQRRFADAETLSQRSLLLRAASYISGLRSAARLAESRGIAQEAADFRKKAQAVEDVAGIARPGLKLLPRPKPISGKGK
ncbi:MAG: tetratricopeptide repeat protein [Bryobacteraceae bacterium]|nr:tetratricopeptide repeat protein [Bryobacteraceae bacterium]